MIRARRPNDEFRQGARRSLREKLAWTVGILSVYPAMGAYWGLWAMFPAALLSITLVPWALRDVWRDERTFTVRKAVPTRLTAGSEPEPVVDPTVLQRPLRFGEGQEADPRRTW